MELHKAIIRPGTVREVLENGEIKASAPGLFSFTDDPAKMPPIMPCPFIYNSNGFSKLKLYDEVWIMNFTDNPRQLYWFRKDKIQMNENLLDIINNEANVEILCNRDVAGDWCSIYFSDGSGWVISKDDSIINIRPDGSIMLNTGTANRCIDINASNISIGSEGESAHPAAYGDKTENAIRSICALLGQVATSAIANPYTIPIGTTLMTGLTGVIKNISEISSPHVTID